MKEKIISMLHSNDKDLFLLGIMLALEQGKEWCLENINDLRRETESPIWRTIFYKGDCIIMVGIYKITYATRSKASLFTKWKTINY